MSSLVEDFLLKALHVFQVRTLPSLGFRTRVTLSNKSHNKGDLITDYRIDVTVYAPDGKSSESFENIATLPSNSAISLDCGPWQRPGTEDQVMIFHLMPMRLLPKMKADGTLDLDRAEIWSLFTAQDHYVEYYAEDGFSSGVLYQSGAFNYQKFSREETTVIQAPKIHVSPTLDTILSVIYTSFAPEGRSDAILRCALLDDAGKLVAQRNTKLPLFSPRLISMKEMAASSGLHFNGDHDMKSYTLLALCDNAALLPLVFNHDAVKGAFAIEHSLPPMYYGPSVTGSVRARMVGDLRKSGLFLEEA